MTALRKACMALALGLGLAACANSTPSQVAQDVAALSGALGALAPAFAGVGGITAAQGQGISTAIGAIQAEASAFAAADGQAAQQPIVARIETDVNALLAVTAAFPLPPQISAGLAAARVLLPVIEAALGMIPPAASALRPQEVTPTVPAARQTLQQLSAQQFHP